MITVIDLAQYRGLKENADGSVSMQAFEDVGLPMFGGCQRCEASIAAYNACPSKNGYLLCVDCVDENGYETVEAANIALFPEEYTWSGVKP